MTGPSPSERELADGTLVLFPDGEPDERAPLAASVSRVVHVQVLLRDVRDDSQPIDSRREWFERAWDEAQSLGKLPWFTLHLALVRHAALVGHTERAGALASELVDQLRDRPGPDISNQDSKLRDALYRAQRALRVPILARTIKLRIADPLPRILELVHSDRTIDDRSRIEVLVRILGGVRKLGVDDAPIVSLLEAAGSSTSAYVRRLHDAWFKREASKKYLARPIYEFDRVPQELHHRRVNAGILTFKEY